MCSTSMAEEGRKIKPWSRGGHRELHESQRSHESHLTSVGPMGKLGVVGRRPYGQCGTRLPVRPSNLTRLAVWDVPRHRFGISSSGGRASGCPPRAEAEAGFVRALTRGQPPTRLRPRPLPSRGEGCDSPTSEGKIHMLHCKPSSTAVVLAHWSLSRQGERARAAGERVRARSSVLHGPMRTVPDSSGRPHELSIPPSKPSHHSFDMFVSNPPSPPGRR